MKLSTAPEIPLKAGVVSNISLILSELVMLQSAAKINISSSSTIPAEFEPPPVILDSLKISSTSDLAANFRLFLFLSYVFYPSIISI